MPMGFVQDQINDLWKDHRLTYALGFESAHRFRMERTARRRSAEELPALKLLNRRMVRVFVTPECKKTSLFPLVWD